jgi:hypothetical protein
MEKRFNLNEKFEEDIMLTDFLETYPNVQVIKQMLWELLIAAMGSEHANMWDGKARAEKLFFYEQMVDFIEKIYNKIGEQKGV